jgi:Macrocin-O-methyltransferase (TylF)
MLTSPITKCQSWLQYVLTRCGSILSTHVIHKLNAAVSYLEVGRWMRDHGYDTCRRYRSREQLFDLVGSQIGDRDVLYLEFGVWQGEATRYWSKLLRCPQAKMHGFDSFEGMPESWNYTVPTGHFSTGGRAPQIQDPRVLFFKGWFSDTLPKYKMPAHDVLILNMDADLYSSTIFVLNTLRDSIVPGTYIYFDEFYDRLNELRAFDEFLKSGMKFRLLGATRTLRHALFQREP